MSGDNAQWYWNASSNPFSSSVPAQWTAYSREDNKTIEEHFQNKSSKVELKNHIIHLQDRMQINKQDFERQRPIKREPKV